MEIIQDTAMLKSARILRKVLDTCKVLLSLRLQKRPQSNTVVNDLEFVLLVVVLVVNEEEC